MTTWRDYFRFLLRPSDFRLASVSSRPIGPDNDGTVFRPAGTIIDKPWGELFQEFSDAREAWRNNPLARRMIGLISAYTISTGIKLTTQYRPLQRFIDDFWSKNQLSMLLDEWSDELARSGELFPVLFTNPITGMSQIRTVPAQLIDAIDYDLDDYTQEKRYRESTILTLDPSIEKWWQGPAQIGIGPETPLMLHYAVNRPTGALRGESDLAPILPWLKRYTRWLEDRVRLNAALRAFLWIVHVPARLRATVEERYRTPPEPGTVIIAETDAETWEAVTPSLNATDAEKDGRAIRWMIVSGGPGTALIDIGEGEDANQATAKVMTEQRQRFLRRRQAYIGWMLKDMTIHAWNRYAELNPTTRTRPVMPDEINVIAPDISPEDNQALAAAASSLTSALNSLAFTVGQGPAFRRMALRMFAKFAGETLTDAEMTLILEEGAANAEAHAQPQASPDESDDGRLPRNGNEPRRPQTA